MILDHQLEIRQIRDSAEHFWKTRSLKLVTLGFTFDLHSLYLYFLISNTPLPLEVCLGNV